jgi:Holliday junction resolvase
VNPSARLRGKLNKIAGQAAENIAESQLRGLNVETDQLETGWAVVRAPLPGGKGTRIVDARPLRKVLGDIVGAQHGSGRLVLVECKHDDGDRLSLSELKDHQRKTLLRWHQVGALCLVAWVRFEPAVECLFIHYPSAASEWITGHPLTLQRARELNQHARAALSNRPPPRSVP